MVEDINQDVRTIIAIISVPRICLLNPSTVNSDSNHCAATLSNTSSKDCVTVMKLNLWVIPPQPVHGVCFNSSPTECRLSPENKAVNEGLLCLQAYLISYLYFFYKSPR